MKNIKRVWSVAVVLVVILGIALSVWQFGSRGTAEPDPAEPVTETPGPLGGCPPSLQWDGELYGCVVFEKRDSSIIGPVVGYVTSVVGPYQMPTEDGQVNFPEVWGTPIEGAPIAECEEGIAILGENGWIWLPPYESN